MEVKTFDGKVWKQEEILPKMYDDGFYYGYLGQNAMSSSSFKKCLDGYETYIADRDKGPEAKEPQALRDGRLIHLQALEPERIAELTIIDSTKGSKAYKNAVNELNSAVVYTQREINKCIPLANKVKLDFESYCLLDGATMETPAIQMVEGIPVRGKADILRVSENHIIDLKTTSDASRFEEAINHWSYDLQGALYLHLFNCTRFSFIVLDKITGSVSVRELSPAELKRGQEKLNKAISIFKDGKEKE
tara:strand:+ start:655 stop:1398 length:744 start_codon:yes stop_codon:yes gene_type:complete